MKNTISWKKFGTKSVNFCLAVILIGVVTSCGTRKAEEQFIQWCNIGKCTLKVFEDAEIYEDCILIKQVLEEKIK